MGQIDREPLLFSQTEKQNSEVQNASKTEGLKIPPWQHLCRILLVVLSLQAVFMAQNSSQGGKTLLVPKGILQLSPSTVTSGKKTTVRESTEKPTPGIEEYLPCSWGRGKGNFKLKGLLWNTEIRGVRAEPRFPGETYEELQCHPVWPSTPQFFLYAQGGTSNTLPAAPAACSLCSCLGRT